MKKKLHISFALPLLQITCQNDEQYNMLKNKDIF